MNPQAEPTVLYILSVLVTVLILLVGAIYMTVRKAQEKSDDRQEKLRVETSDALKRATDSHDALRKERVEALEQLRRERIAALDRAEQKEDEIHRELWREINGLKDKYGNLDKQHSGWCQKHEDQLNALKKEDDWAAAKIYKDSELLDKLKNRVEKLEK